MLRFQISVQKTFPKVMLSAAGTGSLESMSLSVGSRGTVHWMYWGEWEQVELVPAGLMLLQRFHAPLHPCLLLSTALPSALIFILYLLLNLRSLVLPAL